ncbi:hypothetical protein Ddye_031193 [Dipteronia dyeriana]|uniref:KIB1-4 beta-propeller domain-containing protein n=1 Tax=Dipteronia dyeriana TaxID=168575 RepID=A0AAD9TI34_9ROSI|nr:hypothetical protein Ddye_031193 [Dipteronia dyeriana]
MAHNWDDLPMELLMEIAKLLTRFEDYTPFSGVFTSWQSVAACLYPIPLLMLPPRKDSHALDFYHLSDRIVNRISLSEALTGKRCYSSKGCLITIGHDLNVNLMHPFSNLQHKFPNIKTIDNWDENYGSSCYDRFINKCFLSVNPLLESDYILMVIFGGFKRLVYARPGDETWTVKGEQINYSDITYYRGQCYVVNLIGRVFACCIGGDDNLIEPEVVARLPSKFLEDCPDRLYIVESAGALLIITRFVYSVNYEDEESVYVEDEDEESVYDEEEDEESIYDEDEDEESVYDEEEDEDEVFNFPICTSYISSKFQAFNVDLSTKTCTEIKDLDDRIIFLGHNSSFSLACPPNCKPNSLYFTDDSKDTYIRIEEGGGKDIGIYSLQDGSITPHFIDKSLDPLTPPMWIEHSFI